MKAKLNHVTVTVVDREATNNEDKFKKVDLYGKSASAYLNSVKNSPFLSGRVADVELTAKSNPETGELAVGHLGNIKFFDAADGTRIDDPKERRYKVNLDRITFTTENKEAKEYDVSKPVYRDRETGNVTNLEDGKVPGLKTILAAMNEDGELFLHVNKTEIDKKDVWVIADAKPLTGPSTEQKADQPKYSITVTPGAEGMVSIAGPEIKDSKELQAYLKEDLGAKWDTKNKAWNAPLPEGTTVGKLFYAVIEKARELQVTPSPEASMKEMAANAPEGASLADAAASVGKQKAAQQKMKA